MCGRVANTQTTANGSGIASTNGHRHTSTEREEGERGGQQGLAWLDVRRIQARTAAPSLAMHTAQHRPRQSGTGEIRYILCGQGETAPRIAADGRRGQAPCGRRLRAGYLGCRHGFHRVLCGFVRRPARHSPQTSTLWLSGGARAQVCGTCCRCVARVAGVWHVCGRCCLPVMVAMAVALMSVGKRWLCRTGLCSAGPRCRRYRRYRRNQAVRQGSFSPRWH